MGPDLGWGRGMGRKGRYNHTIAHEHVYTYVHACMCAKMYVHACTQTHSWREYILAITNPKVHYVHLCCVVIHDDVTQVWPTPLYIYTINDVPIPNDMLENGCGIC